MDKIVIIGGGFAGLTLVKHLDKKKFDIHLVDRNNFHCFPPLFYQIASSGLDASDISFPFRRELRKYGKNVAYHMGHVKGIDTANKTVTTSYETIPYDKLVIAAGTTNNFYGIEGIDHEVFCIKTIPEAIHTREEILDRLERGAICTDPQRRRQLLSFLVVGGGPTGVEIAGALGEMKRYILPREYPELDPEDVNITLVEGSDRLLQSMSHKSSAKALGYLRSLMVDVRLGTTVRRYENKTVSFSDGHDEYLETLIWTAGVKGEQMPGIPDPCIGKGGRITVDSFNRVENLPDTFAIGDIALMETADFPNGHPQLAQPAMQQAHNLARNLNRGDFASEFRYNDKGSMATIGKNRAVAEIKNLHISGWPAWITWMSVHLISILGMRNKLTVLLNWIWNYVSYTTSLRLLLRPSKYPRRKHWGD